MPLQKQTAVVPILGLTQKSDPKSGAAGECELIENLMFKRTAGTGAELIKRYGGASLTRNVQGGSALTAGRRLATFGDERLLVSDTALQSYSPLLAKWVSKGTLNQVGLSAEPVTVSIPAAASTHSVVDMAISGNLLCVVYGVGGAVPGGAAAPTQHHVTVIDLGTGARLLNDATIAVLGGFGTLVKVVALTSSFMIFYSPTGGTIIARKIDYATPTTIGAATNVVTDLSAFNAYVLWDVTRNGTNDSVLIAWDSTVPNTKIQIWNSNQTTGGTVTAANEPDQCLGWLNWDASDGKMYLSYVSSAGGGMKTLTITQSALAVSATTVNDAAIVTARNITGYRVGTTNTIFVEVIGAPTTLYNTLIRRSTGGATAVWQRSCGLASRPFKVGSSSYLTASYASPLQTTYFLLDATGATPVVVAKAFYGEAGTPLVGLGNSIPSVVTLATGVVAIPVLRNVLTDPNGATINGTHYLRVDFTGTGLSAPARVGESQIIPGGVTRAYDDNLVGELGFHLFPETPTLTQAAGGSLTALGTYQYRAVYVWSGNRGQVHRSAPSAPASITLTGTNQTVGIVAPTLRISDKPVLAPGVANMGIEIYRTANGGTTLYRVPLAPSHDPTFDASLIATDTSSDATIAGNLILYTDGGILPHIAPPAARYAIAFRNRALLAGTENPLELWVSNEQVTGEGLSFSDALVIALEAEGGAITGLAALDDRAFIFKRGRIYVLGGFGPSLTGDGQYEQPSLVTAEAGTVDGRGIVVMRDGVMFKSLRGMFLLTRGAELLYVGAGVEGYNSLTVTGAAVIEDLEQVRFVTDSGRTLVYHYGLRDAAGVGRWTTFTNQAAVDCCVWNGTFVTLASDGTVTEETAGLYSDPGAVAIAAKVRTAWLNLAGLFGKLRLYGVHLLADFLGTFTVTHRLAYDFDATVLESDSKAVTVATLPPLQLAPAVGRAEAVQITVEETSTTAGFRLSAIGLEVGIKQGAEKSGTAQFLS